MGARRSCGQSFNPLELLGIVVMLACCQSVVPSMSLLNVDLGGTCRNQVACMVALENLQRSNVLVVDYTLSLHTQPVGWPVQKNLLLKKCTA